jgi:multiple sugar transport system permease protein
MYSLYISFLKYDVISEVNPWIGLGNYKEALRDKAFWQSLKNTALYVVTVVPGITIAGFTFAWLGHRVRQGRAFFRTVFFLPSITPMVVLALVWMWLYAPKGMLNSILLNFGIHGPNWLVDVRWAMPSVIIMSIWQAMGYYTVIYLAGLADIPQDFYDAAKVDGANLWQELVHVTIPLLRNVTQFVTVTLAIFAFQVFAQVYIMTKGGPGTATSTMQYLIYRNGFEYFRMGYASALSWLLFVVIFALVIVQLRVQRSEQVF